jgi:hypothetical protein
VSGGGGETYSHKNNGPSSKKGGGKGMRLGYKGKLPGEEKGYYAEKSYGGDDKSFVPAELLLIPRSQNHIRLTYGDRCGIDVFFMQVHIVSISIDDTEIETLSSVYIDVYICIYF